MPSLNTTPTPSPTPSPRSPNRHVRIMCWAVVLLSFAALFCLPFAHGQASNAIAISGQAMQPTGQPAQSASVAVCQITAIGTPCSTTGVNLYYDPNLISPAGNPITTDQYGNYSVFTTTGAYQIQVTPSGEAGPTYVYYDIMGAGVGGLAPPFNTVTTGENTTATMTCGTGCTQTYTGTGVINATNIQGISITGTPSVGMVPMATSASTAVWQVNTTASAIVSNNLSGGSIGSAAYQAAPATTLFIPSPTVAGVYLYAWQPTGTAIAPTAASLASLGIANLSAGAGTQSFLSAITAPTVNGIPLTTAGATSAYLNAAGSYTVPQSAIGNVSVTITAGTQTANSCTPLASSISLAGVAMTAPGNLILWGYTNSTSTLTGWGSSGGMTLHLWPATAGTITGETCNTTGSSIAYSALPIVVSAK